MKLATYSVGGEDRIGLVVDGGVVSIAKHAPGAPATMIELISRWDEFRDRVSALGSAAPDHALQDVGQRAPVPRPGKIMAIGLNYLDHIEESNSEKPEFQTWFAKAATAVSGPYDRIALPAASDRLDFEAELVIVIGKRARGVTREQAREHIFGYCVGNDVRSATGRFAFRNGWSASRSTPMRPSDRGSQPPMRTTRATTASVASSTAKSCSRPTPTSCCSTPTPRSSS